MSNGELNQVIGDKGSILVMTTENSSIVSTVPRSSIKSEDFSEMKSSIRFPTSNFEEIQLPSLEDLNEMKKELNE